LDLKELAQIRGVEKDYLENQIMVATRGLNPLWEDPVTNAVNAADRLLDQQDREEIELLVFATESGVDQEKAAATWCHQLLGLKQSCRSFEIKSACYAGTAAMQMALTWLSFNPGKKALILCGDQSRAHFNRPYEFVMGACGSAVLLSQNPRLFEVDLSKQHYWTQETADLIRPTLHHEIGSTELSLLSYFDGLLDLADEIQLSAKDIESFRCFSYHAPFAGLIVKAHKRLLKNVDRSIDGDAHFKDHAATGMTYQKHLGASYSSSIFSNLLAHYHHSSIQAGDQFFCYSFGSGAHAEVWTSRVVESGHEEIAPDPLAEIEGRERVSVKEYEEIETKRIENLHQGTYSIEVPKNLKMKQCIFRGQEDFYRQYQWVNP
jgi:hydroxymethylglutaryl-CoA synthase